MALLAARIKAFVGHLTSEDLADAEDRARGLKNTTVEEEQRVIKCRFCNFPNRREEKKCARCARALHMADILKAEEASTAELELALERMLDKRGLIEKTVGLLRKS